MDPVTLILAALAAGAAAGAKDIAGDVVRDTYGALKSLVRRRFQGDQAEEIALEKHAEDPQVWNEPLKKALTDSGADQDDEILRRAKELLEKIPPDSEVAKYVNNIYGGEVGAIVQGGGNTVTINRGGAAPTGG
jgi:hypothetical protein